MARDVISVTEGVNIGEVWSLLHKHKVKALPVVNDKRQVIGIVTIADFLKDLAVRAVNPIAGLGDLVVGQPDSEGGSRPVAEIMTRNVLTESIDTPVAELIKRLSDMGMHHVPIVNQQGELVGMVTQSDLIASMYQKIVLGSR